MRIPIRNSSLAGWHPTMWTLGGAVLVIAVLHFAREVLIPIALSILLTFVLAPIVNVLRRRGVGRLLSVILTVSLGLLILVGVGMTIYVEFKNLADDLPAYRQNIRKKVAQIRLASRGGSLEKIQGTVKEIAEEIHKDDPVDTTNPSKVPVVVAENKLSSNAGMTLIGPLLRPVGTTGFIIVLVVFMLLRREELRDRLVRLTGHGRLATTTKAIDEAGKRLSKYLLRQFLLNCGFGVTVGVGLHLIGLPYSVLWGVLAGVARFIPYAGPILATASPSLVSLAVFDGWRAPLMVIALVVGLEFLISMVLEPLLYGHSVGVSEVALLVMMAFWTWLWGPIGLILATPLTVCLMVISKVVPDLEFVRLLLSSEPVLGRHHVFYQRLVAKDQDEAQDIVDAFLKENARTDLFEQLLIPTLVSCREDVARERLDEADQAYIHRSIRGILEVDEGNHRAAANAADERSPGEGPSPADPASKASGRRPRKSEGSAALPTSPYVIVGCPASDEADELALLMVAELMIGGECQMSVLSPNLLSSESLAQVAATNPSTVCVGALSGGPLLPLRQFCKRLRKRCPHISIVVGYWGGTSREGLAQPLTSGIDAVSWTLSETVSYLIQFGHIRPMADTGGTRPDVEGIRKDLTVTDGDSVFSEA